MSPLVRAALAARRGLRGLATLALTAALAFAVVLDAVSPLPVAWAIAVAATIVLVCGRTLVRRMRSIDTTAFVEIELGALAMIGAFFLVVRADRSLDGDAYATVYLCLAVVSAFARPAATLVALLLGVGLEIGIRMIARGEPNAAGAAQHAAFMVVFTGFNAAVLRTEIARVRSASSTRLTEEMERLRQDARSFRLLGGPTPDTTRSAESDDERLLMSGVEEIHQSVLFALRLLRESLNLHTTMLLWQNDAGTHLRISELVSDDPDLLEGPFMSGDGIFGAALSRGAAVTLDGLKPGYALPYYATGCPARAVAAIPVHEHGKIRGLLVADRIEDRAFTAREQALLEEAARYAVRAIHNERVFLQLERAKVEQGKLYRAAETLGSAKTEAQVIEAGVHSAREITSVDYAALTLFDEATRTHEISITSGDFPEGDGTATTGARFRHNSGLVSMALENRHPLPYRGLYDDKKQVVFTRHLTPPKMPSIFVMPLLAHDRPLGTLVLGSRRRGAFGEAVRGTLEVLASHMAVSLEGARMLTRLEELATTDGLTGLLNKRAMLESAEQKIAAARRHGRPIAVLVTDIDHFKRVNDTYGHDVGDIIIKGLGSILSRAKRTTDAVARFGGEEFVLICDETDERGATQLAERVRQELAKTTFTAGPGPDGQPQAVRVTCSIGIATYPAAGTTWDGLFKAADTALYASKQGGRNRVTVFGRDKSEVAA
jgi:diguanylate cyclase (GGDEF)-like protein